MQRITSAEFQKNFGKYKREALTDPLTVTIHGKDTLVVMSHEAYAEVENRAADTGQEAPRQSGTDFSGRPLHRS